MWFIYTLSDPRTNEVRYVGQTRNVRLRMNSHRFNARHPDRGNHPVLVWIRGLLEAGLEPRLGTVLLTAPTREEADRIEREQIAKYDDLLNRTTGGVIGHKVDSSAREKMRLAKLGKKQSPEMIAARRAGLAGHFVSAETREKIAATKRGKPRDDATKAKIAASLKARNANTKQER